MLLYSCCLPPHLYCPCNTSVPQDALDMSLKMALSIPLSDILAYRWVGVRGAGVVRVGWCRPSR